MNSIAPDDAPLPFEVIQAMTPAQRMQRVLELNRIEEERAIAGIRAKYPDATSREIFLRRAEQKLGRELALQAFPDLANLRD